MEYHIYQVHEEQKGKTFRGQRGRSGEGAATKGKQCFKVVVFSPHSNPGVKLMTFIYRLIQKSEGSQFLNIS